MACVQDIWAKHAETTAGKDQFFDFLNDLGIALERHESDDVFDIVTDGMLTFDQVKVWFALTKVYDPSKYPKPYKLVPTINTEKKEE